MKTIIRIMSDDEKFWAASVVSGKPQQLGPFDSIDEVLCACKVKGGKKCGLKQKKFTREKGVTTESS